MLNHANPSAEHLFGVTNISFRYPNKECWLFKNFTWGVYAGEVICVAGSNGCGKTTLLQLCMGLAPNESVHPWSRRPAAMTGIHYVPQEGIETLLPWQNVLDNVALPVRLRGLDRGDARQEAARILTLHPILAALQQYANEYPYRLSGGWQQLVLMARAFASNSRVLVLDEPFRGLDVVNRRRLRDLVLWYRVYTPQVAFVIVTHELNDAVLLADRIDILPNEKPVSDVRHHVLPTTARTLALPEIASVLDAIRAILEEPNNGGNSNGY